MHFPSHLSKTRTKTSIIATKERKEIKFCEKKISIKTASAGTNHNTQFLNIFFFIGKEKSHSLSLILFSYLLFSFIFSVYMSLYSPLKAKGTPSVARATQCLNLLQKCYEENNYNYYGTIMKTQSPLIFRILLYQQFFLIGDIKLAFKLYN